MTLLMVRSSSFSSSSSSSNDQREFYVLFHVVDEAHQCYSDATREVGRLERCLDTIRVALAALERETTTMQAATTDAQADIVGEGSLHIVILYDIHSF